MDFSKKEIILTSWNKTKNNISILLSASMIYLLAIIILFQIFSIMSPEFIEDIIVNNLIPSFQLSFQQILFIIAALLFITGLNLGFIKICLNIYYNKESSPTQLLKSFHVLIPYLFATFIYIMAHFIAAIPGLLIMLLFINFNASNIYYYMGLLLIIIPPFYISLRLQFYIYFLLDNEEGIIAAIKKSASISQGFVYQLFILGVILSILVQLAIIPYFIGLIIALPYTKMVSTYAYIKLNQSNINQ